MTSTRTNKTRYLALGLLSEGPLTGYEIRRLTGVRFRHFWSESYGQLYPALVKLEKDGMVCGEAAPRGGRQRRVYTATEAGLRALREWLAESVEPETARYEILLKVYFSSQSSPAVLRRHVLEFRERIRQGLQELEGYARQVSSAPDPVGNHDRVLMTIDFGVRTFRAYVQWADAVLAGDKPAGPEEAR
jgi:DNA-binding PadR family transcriptional regulator